MMLPYLDTDVIIRLLTGDDPAKQAAASALFEHVEKGSLTIAAPDTVIADAVYVLTSPRLYNLSRAHVAALLTALIRLTQVGDGIGSRSGELLIRPHSAG